MSAPETLTVAHVVFPTEDQEAIRPLYIDAGPDAAQLLGRHAVRVPAGRTASLGTYFNAFPASYWQVQSAAGAVMLNASLTGHGELALWRSDERARMRCVRRYPVSGDATLQIELALSGFDEGGAYWFDLAGDRDGLTLNSAHWSIAGVAASTITIALTTFNRPVECLRQLVTIGRDRDLAEIVDRVVVVDQGDRRLNGEDGFPAVVEVLGSRLRLVTQPNLGGSGGFSRGMLEAMAMGESSHVLLLDDDAVTEPESIFRAVRFAEAARRPIIVSGGMFHLDRRSVLYAQSEQWDERIAWVKLDRPAAYDHDFEQTPYREAPFFHRTQASDIGGWWMCLIPLTTIREIGLALPFFLKGDDFEFALRARSRGADVVSPPGIAIWHMGWVDKKPTQTWEAYFLHRNRLIIALLHADRRRPALIVAHAFLGDAKVALKGWRAASALRARAVEDACAGPAALRSEPVTKVEEVRSAWMSADRATDRWRARAVVNAAAAAVRLWWGWPRFSAQYRAAASDLSSPQSWRRIIGEQARD